MSKKYRRVHGAHFLQEVLIKLLLSVCQFPRNVAVNSLKRCFHTYVLFETRDFINRRVNEGIRGAFKVVNRLIIPVCINASFDFFNDFL